MGDHTSVAMQHAATRFLNEGHMSARLRLLRALIAQRREVLCAALARWLPAWVRAGPLDGDGHACLHLPAAWPDIAVASDLRARGVLSFALSSMCMQPYGLNALVIGYAAYSAPEIEHAIEQLGAVLRGLQAAGSSPQRYQPAGEKT